MLIVVVCDGGGSWERSITEVLVGYSDGGAS